MEGVDLVIGSKNQMANPGFGLPYGSLPRLLLAWMTREAKRTSLPNYGNISRDKAFAEGWL